MADTRHAFVLWYLLFAGIYLLLGTLATTVYNAGQSGALNEANFSEYTYDNATGTFSSSPDPIDFLANLINFTTAHALLNAILIIPGGLFMAWIMTTVVGRGT